MEEYNGKDTGWENQIPAFDDNGFLPPGCFSSTLKGFKCRFVLDFTNSKTRAEIFNEYIGYANHLSTYNFTINKWIGGSYVSNKLDPGDVDIVILFDAIKYNSHPERGEIHNLFLRFHGYPQLLHHSMYIAVYPKSDPRYELITKVEVKKWHDFISMTKDKKTKRGLILLNTMSEEYNQTLNEEVVIL